MTRLGVIGAAAALALLVTTQVNAQGALPQGEGRDIVAVACTQCHALTPILTGREGTAGWRKHVHNMVLRGAQVSPAEAETVIRYLTANFGPGAAPPGKVAVTLPAGAGKELVETRCAVCHTLERVTIVRRDKGGWETIVANMYERWGQSAPDEVQAISNYLVAQFGTK
jgi:mono/diheme cytochrome c family protein